MAGKGDSPRPVDGDRYRANYEAIFCQRPQRLTWAEAERLLEEDPSSLVSVIETDFDASARRDPAGGWRL
jgi:hypothetical protein